MATYASYNNYESNPIIKKSPKVNYEKLMELENTYKTHTEPQTKL
jgi:hypothetical protein